MPTVDNNGAVIIIKLFSNGLQIGNVNQKLEKTAIKSSVSVEQ